MSSQRRTITAISKIKSQVYDIGFSPTIPKQKASFDRKNYIKEAREVKKTFSDEDLARAEPNPRP